MTAYSVRLSVAARIDISEIETWIAGQADENVAARYVDRIERYILQLAVFPDRGSPRPDVGTGMRSITFERRYLILYAVAPPTVTVQRVISGSRDLTALQVG